ncbi:MAG TPA: DNA-3-methyladenine glycosylase 2 family protein [Chloroflexota bacterium]
MPSTAFRLDTPINLRETLFSARIGPRDPCLRIFGDEVWRATRTPLGPTTERITLATDGTVNVEAWGDGAEWLLERAPALCGAHDDATSFTPADALLQRLAHEHAGLRLGRTGAVFEAALGIVVEQRVASPDAWESWRWLVYSLGERAPGPKPGLWVPPSPERIAHTPYEVFHRFGVERRRADVLKRLGVVARRLEESVDLSLEDAYKRFAAIPGVGPWTRGRLGLTALGDPDALLLGDLHVPHLVTQALAGERRGSDERMLELLEPYRGHRARVVRLLMTHTLAATRSRADSRLPLAGTRRPS